MGNASGIKWFLDISQCTSRKHWIPCIDFFPIQLHLPLSQPSTMNNLRLSNTNSHPIVICLLRDPLGGDSSSVVLSYWIPSPVIVSCSFLNFEKVNFGKAEFQGDVGSVQLENATRYLLRCTVLSFDVKCQVKCFIGITSRPPRVNRWVEECFWFSSVYFILLFASSLTSIQEISKKSKQLPLNVSLKVSLII